MTTRPFVNPHDHYCRYCGVETYCLYVDCAYDVDDCDTHV